jgi:hypothetical protein
MSGVSHDINLIHDLITAGYSIERMSQLTGYTISYLTRNFGCFYKKQEESVFGYKDSAYYFTEEEMLSEPVYTYESLSPSEKAIYDELAED